MSFRVRLAGLGLLLGLLVAAFLLGLILSPQRRERREAEQPLLPPHSLEATTALEVRRGGAVRVGLAKQEGRWVVLGGGEALPASAERVAALLKGLLEARRGRVVGTGQGPPAGTGGGQAASLRAQLGLTGAESHSLVLRRAGGAPELELLVGKRGPSGQEDYVALQGEPEVYLVRGSLGPTLEQDRTYWYDLHLLPEDVLGTTVARIRVSGGAGRGYTLVRRAGQEGQWSVEGETRAVNRLAAGAMANSLALLQGVDFQLGPPQGAVGPAAVGPGEEGLQVQVTTLQGKSYSLEVRRAADPEKRLVTAAWSGRTYVVNAVALRRAVLPLEELLGQ